KINFSRKNNPGGIIKLNINESCNNMNVNPAEAAKAVIKAKAFTMINGVIAPLNFEINTLNDICFTAIFSNSNKTAMATTVNIVNNKNTGIANSKNAIDSSMKSL